MSVEAAEAVEAAEVVEAVDAEQAFGRLERLYAQLPAMEEKGAALARARSAAEVDGLAKAAAYRAAELARAEAEVARADARVCEAEAALARSMSVVIIRQALTRASSRRCMGVLPA